MSKSIVTEVRELGYNFLPKPINDRLFGTTPEVSSIEKARFKSMLDQFGYSLEPQQPYEMPFPDLDEWLGQDTPESVLEAASGPLSDKMLKARSFLTTFDPPKPPSIKTIQANLKSGWIQYHHDGSIQSVDYPLDEVGVYDVETWVRRRNYPLMAGFLSEVAYYLWLHPALVGEANFSTSEPVLVPLGPDPKILIGYNVLFDANKTQEAYKFFNPNCSWIDLMSLHIASNGASSEQSGLLKKKKGLPIPKPWAKYTTPSNNLLNAYNLHCEDEEPLTEDDKSIRNIFKVTGSIQVFKDILPDLSKYNLLDLFYTFKLGSKLLPKYLLHNPKPFTWSGSLIMGNTLLPVVSDWDQWVARVESKWADTQTEIDQGLKPMADLLLAQGDVDVWTSQLDWTPLKSGKNEGKPKWYAKIQGKKLTPANALAPILLKMSWDGKPLFRHPKFKWCFILPEKSESSFTYEFKGQILHLRKLPHPKGEAQNCGNPLGKDYLPFMENGTLSSPDPHAQEYLNKAKSVSFWTLMRKRALQFYTHPSSEGFSSIKPLMNPHGTVTRRAVEPTWLTAPDVKKNVIGSELKSRIQAPPGYKLVGADFAAQELCIGSLAADSKLGLVGSSPMGFTQMLGDKDKGTDGHSTLANYLSVDRQLAKTLNFLMLFFGGMKGLFEAIKANRIDLPDDAAKSIADKALKLRRGKRDRATGLFSGGTDSNAYNWMIKQAETPDNRTILGRSAISRALWRDVVGKDFMPSRCNRNIQGTGVDLLHILLTLTYHFANQRNLEMAYVISIHDEAWFLVKEDHVEEFTRCFQVAHLLCWVFLLKAMGFESIPAAYCFFPSVNVDVCLRKEVTNQSVKIDGEWTYIGLQTPSNEGPELPQGYEIKPKKMTW